MPVENKSFALTDLADTISTSNTNINQFANSLQTLSSTLDNINKTPCKGKELNECEISTEKGPRTVTSIITDAQDQIDAAISNARSLTQNTTDLLQHSTSTLSQIDAAFQLNNSIANKTLTNISQQNQALGQQINNKRRMTEINNYYANMNTYINNVIRNLVIILCIIILLSLLSRKGIIPNNISQFITVVGVLAIIGYVVYSVYDINIRDKFNFVEYIIPFDNKAHHLEASGNNSTFTDIRQVLGRELIGGLKGLENIGNTCIGADCCLSGTIYDVNRRACITNCKTGEVYQQTTNPNTGKLEGSCVSETSSSL